LRCPCLVSAAETLPWAEEMKKLMWLFGCPLVRDDVAQEPWLVPGSNDLLLEVGPRYVAGALGSLSPRSQACLPFTLPTQPSPPFLSPLVFGDFSLFHPSLCLGSHTNIFPGRANVLKAELAPKCTLEPAAYTRRA
jgi:hypothetical protein